MSSVLIGYARELRQGTKEYGRSSGVGDLINRLPHKTDILAGDGTVRLRPKRRPQPTAAVLDRDIPPPLRRWAADRITRRDPGRSPDVLVRVQTVHARAADAAMSGLLDAGQSLPDEARSALVALDEDGLEDRERSLTGAGDDSRPAQLAMFG